MHNSKKDNSLLNDDVVAQASGGLTVESNKQTLIDNNTIIGNNNVQLNMSNNSISNKGDVFPPEETFDATSFLTSFFD